MCVQELEVSVSSLGVYDLVCVTWVSQLVDWVHVEAGTKLNTGIGYSAWRSGIEAV